VLAQEIQRTLKWTYDDYVFTQTLSFKQSDYDEYYRSLKKDEIKQGS
jgi:hypothetical protein